MHVVIYLPVFPIQVCIPVHYEMQRPFFLKQNMEITYSFDMDIVWHTRGNDCALNLMNFLGTMYSVWNLHIFFLVPHVYLSLGFNIGLRP